MIKHHDNTSSVFIYHHDLCLQYPCCQHLAQWTLKQGRPRGCNVQFCIGCSPTIQQLRGFVSRCILRSNMELQGKAKWLSYSSPAIKKGKDSETRVSKNTIKSTKQGFYETQLLTDQRLSSAMFACCLFVCLSRIGNISTYLHYMMF